MNVREKQSLSSDITIEQALCLIKWSLCANKNLTYDYNDLLVPDDPLKFKIAVALLVFLYDTFSRSDKHVLEVFSANKQNLSALLEQISELVVQDNVKNNKMLSERVKVFFANAGILKDGSIDPSMPLFHMFTQNAFNIGLFRQNNIWINPRIKELYNIYSDVDEEKYDHSCCNIC